VWQVLEAIQQGIDKVNKTAVSNAQRVQKWSILRRDFSVFGGELGQSLICVLNRCSFDLVCCVVSACLQSVFT